MKTALVCTNSGIGNALSSLPLIEALSRLGYAIDVTVNSERHSEPVFTAHPNVSRAHMRPFNDTSAYDEVFCCSYCMHNLGRRTGCGRETNRVIPPFMGDAENCRFRFKKHEIEYFVDMAREVGWTGPVPKTKLPKKPPPFELPRNSIALSVGYWKGDGHSHRKHWGNANYVELSRLLISKGYTPVFIGSQADWKADARFIADELPSTTFIYDQDLLTAFGALNDCCGYVGNETCMVPAAAVLGKPALSLIMKEAEPHLICPQKNYPYPHGMALMGRRKALTPALVARLVIRLIERGPIQEIMEI